MLKNKGILKAKGYFLLKCHPCPVSNMRALV